MLFVTLNQDKSDKLEQLFQVWGRGVVAQAECGSRQAEFAVRIRTAAQRNLSGAEGPRVILKTHYDVAPVEFWQEIVDNPGWD